MHEITVISKHGCHLCERAIETLESLKENRDFKLRIIYIENDESLHDTYYLKIPVVRLDGRDILEAIDIALPRDCPRKLGDLVFSLQ
ncbi:MAG TPA: glutaredoxin family protein [Nitrososphaerales archaeon]|nr:glutaredoxin family protein [Nitrososphaerales archaeon]